MRIRFALLGVVVATALAATGAAIAGGHTAPGTPGTASCQGQTMAYLNEAFKTTYQVNGIGNIADFANEVTVQQVQDVVDAFCA
ncbi:MAG: hypothetical protein ACYDA3_10650 [Gaiellaceae bacterium]